MSDLVKIEVVDGWETSVDADGDRRVLDLDIAERAGLSRPINVRGVIKGNLDELRAHGPIICRRKINSESLGNGRGRPAEEYWLNEDQSYALSALLRTPQAKELRIGLVKLFGAVRRRELTLPAAAAPLSLDVAHGPCVGDVPNLRHDIDAMCRMTARAAGVTLRRVHGFVRKTYRVGGVYQVSALAWPNVRLTLESLALGNIALKAVRALPQGDGRQMTMLLGGAR